MSLDLSWDLLDEHFSATLTAKLNDVLATTKRPDYLGPISLGSLTLGSESPEVGIVDVGDVWPGFLQQEDGRGDVRARPAEAETRHAGPSQPSGGLERRLSSSKRQDRRVVSAPAQRSSLTRFANKNLPFAAVHSGSETPNEESVFNLHENELDADMRMQSVQRARRQRELKSYRQYSDSGRLHRIETGSVASGYNGSVTPWSTTTPGLGWGSGSQAGYFSAWQGAPAQTSSAVGQNAGLLGQEQLSPQFSRAASWQRQSSASPVARFQQMPRRTGTNSYMTWDDTSRLQMDSPYDRSPGDDVDEQSSSLPSLQLQLSLHWTTQSFRVTLNTSLLINHPSPAFMSLPLTITITGLAMQAGGLLAFEVDQKTGVRRAHFCLTVDDEEEPESSAELGPCAVSGTTRSATSGSALGLSSVPQLAVPTFVPGYRNVHSNGARYNTASIPTMHGQEAKPTAGERILYSVNLETSVGQADKHVLKNVAKVERFVVTLVRKAMTDELVFPNFYSVELPS